MSSEERISMVRCSVIGVTEVGSKGELFVGVLIFR
jgi:hypothetical protein